MTVNDVFELRSQGRTEEAYEAARAVYATNKSPHASAAMFWTAVDALKKRINDNRTDEARKIFMALERLLNGVWRAMGREGVDFKRYLHLVEQFAGFLHDGQVARAAHDDADYWLHILNA